MLPKLQKLLDNELDLTQETDTELARLSEACTVEFDRLDNGGNTTDADLAAMERFSELSADIAGEIEGRRLATAAKAARAAELRSRIVTPANPDPAAPDPDGAEMSNSDTDDDDSGEPATPSAGRPGRAELARRGRATMSTRPRDSLVAGGALVASADMLGLGAGDAIDWKVLATAMSRKVEMIGRSETPDQVLCASLVYEYPPERQLGADPWDNASKLDDLFSVDRIMERVRQDGMEALIASGGVCSPVPVDYAIPVQAVTDRPVRDALPTFQATRGGIQFITPPTFAGVGSSASTIWTSAVDATATTATAKPVQTFTCPTTVTELVDAIPTRLQFSNMQARFAPEVVAANTQLALANAARVAEQNLLAKLSARSTITGTVRVASLTRDLFALLELLAQGYRYRNRLPDMFPLRVLLPAWVKGALRSDLLRENAHDADSPYSDQLALTDARVTALFAVRGLIPNWSIDGLAKSVSGTTLSAASAYDWPDQGFGAQASGVLATPLPDASANSASANTYWPTRLTFFLFAEGTFVFLDGGRIDLGLIRDSVLNNQNQYQTFVEPFEGIAKRGYESIQCTVPLSLQGISFGTTSAAALSAMPY